MARVVWPDNVLEQIDRITLYIRQTDPIAAAKMGKRLFAAGESLIDFPNRGRPGTGGMRELTSVPPFILTYRVKHDIVTILAIRHGAQRPLSRLP